MGGRGASSSVAGGGGNRDVAKSVEQLNTLTSIKERREALDGLPVGTTITTFRAEKNGLIEQGTLATWTKQKDGTWKSPQLPNDNRSSYMLAEGAANTADGRTVEAGKVTTESAITLTGGYGKSIGGLRYANGAYDVLKNNNGKREKTLLSGKITNYNGTQYGIRKQGGAYAITHLQSGVLVNDYTQSLKTLNDVSNYIKNTFDPWLQKNGDTVRKYEKDFARTRRGG